MGGTTTGAGTTGAGTTGEALGSVGGFGFEPVFGGTFGKGAGVLPGVVPAPGLVPGAGLPSGVGPTPGSVPGVGPVPGAAPVPTPKSTPTPEPVPVPVPVPVPETPAPGSVPVPTVCLPGAVGRPPALVEGAGVDSGTRPIAWTLPGSRSTWPSCVLAGGAEDNGMNPIRATPVRVSDETAATATAGAPVRTPGVRRGDCGRRRTESMPIRSPPVLGTVRTATNSPIGRSRRFLEDFFNPMSILRSADTRAESSLVSSHPNG